MPFLTKVKTTNNKTEFNTEMTSDMQHAYKQLKAADLSAILFKGNSSF